VTTVTPAASATVARRAAAASYSGARSSAWHATGTLGDRVGTRSAANG
jgi:hypothetical protein